MSVLIFIDHNEGIVRKSSLEALCYGAKIASLTGTTADGIILGDVKEDLASLGKYGVQKIYQAKLNAENTADTEIATQALAEAVKTAGATIIIFTHNLSGKSIAPRLSAKLKASLVTGAISLPDLATGFVVKKNVFSGKAFANINMLSDIKIISLNSNSYPISAGAGSAEIVPLSIPASRPRVKLRSVSKSSGEVSLTEAEIVVSGGRGLKGPENWGIIEDLAKALHAATACSRPVADANWRPHHEHVGQTGLAIAPNLYIAIGISGAIQHLAGVNRSKVIVVINKDPEAPFFKAADYGIVGDAFEVVPKMTEAVKKLKNS